MNHKFLKIIFKNILSTAFKLLKNTNTKNSFRVYKLSVLTTNNQKKKKYQHYNILLVFPTLMNHIIS